MFQLRNASPHDQDALDVKTAAMDMHGQHQPVTNSAACL